MRPFGGIVALSASAASAALTGLTISFLHWFSLTGRPRIFTLGVLSALIIISAVLITQQRISFIFVDCDNDDKASFPRDDEIFTRHSDHLRRFRFQRMARSGTIPHQGKRCMGKQVLRKLDDIIILNSETIPHLFSSDRYHAHLRISFLWSTETTCSLPLRFWKQIRLYCGGTVDYICTDSSVFSSTSY